MSALRVLVIDPDVHSGRLDKATSRTGIASPVRMLPRWTPMAPAQLRREHFGLDFPALPFAFAFNRRAER
ncbi:hypothetical protein ACNKHN_04685 [Shigella flexneri]